MNTEELLALVGKATPGPWRISMAAPYMHFQVSSVAGTRVFRTTDATDFDASPERREANAALIVAAVNALPALCAEVEALRKDAERYRWLAQRLTRMDVHDVADRCAYPERDDIDAAIDAARSRNEHEG